MSTVCSRFERKSRAVGDWWHRTRTVLLTYNPILCLLYCIFNNHHQSLHVEPEKIIQKAFSLVQIKLNDITPKILDNVSGSLHQLNEYLKLRFLNSEMLLTTILQRSCQPIYKTTTPPPRKEQWRIFYFLYFYAYL